MKNLVKIIIVSLVLSAGAGAQAAIVVFNTIMDGDQANAGNGTGSLGSGAGTMTLDTDTGEFLWFIAWQDLTGTVSNAHFHGPAAPGTNGGVQVGIDFSSNPTEGSASLSDQQISDLLAGLWYVNIHSTFAPGGEIRGQVLAVRPVPLPAAIWLFGAALLGLGSYRIRPA